MLSADSPALILAPMDGITDAPMRALQGEIGSYSFAVSEFLRVSDQPLPAKVFLREVPELATGSRTCTGLPVQVQILGGHPERMARSAVAACKSGAAAIDINFGCPAPVVNRHDGGALLLQHPCRIREIVRAVRDAVPADIPVSAKLRLGWDSIDAVHENARMAAEGGANWVTIHARTRTQGYTPPVFWEPVGQVRRSLSIPVVVNGDIWNIDDFRRCRDESGCEHFMIGRSALANPALSGQIAAELGLPNGRAFDTSDWILLLQRLVYYTEQFRDRVSERALMRLKQWLKFATNFGGFPHFDAVKRAETLDELFDGLRAAFEVDRALIA